MTVSQKINDSIRLFNGIIIDGTTGTFHAIAATMGCSLIEREQVNEDNFEDLFTPLIGQVSGLSQVQSIERGILSGNSRKALRLLFELRSAWSDPRSSLGQLEFSLRYLLHEMDILTDNHKAARTLLFCIGSETGTRDRLRRGGFCSTLWAKLEDVRRRIEQTKEAMRIGHSIVIAHEARFPRF